MKEHQGTNPEETLCCAYGCQELMWAAEELANRIIKISETHRGMDLSDALDFASTQAIDFLEKERVPG